ncbi:MAG: starch-binding protein [Ruminococcus sp.]|nr:starch-binding protein [Ruminococcus sp.]
MRFKKHAVKCAVSFMMAIVLLFSMVVATAAVDADVATTGVSGTVYFRNTAGWSTVNAYVWVQGTSTAVQAWPGQAMTLDEGDVYKYTFSGDYNMIIFNNGSAQTADLSIPGAGQIYDYSTGTWSPYKEEPTTDDPTQATQAPTQGGDTKTKMVYCKDSAGWGSVNVYMWSGSGSSKNAEWPGVRMTDIGDGMWQYEVTGNWENIIFNNGSGSQTGDLSYPGDGALYDNKTGQWDVYDDSPIKITAFGSDLAAPQYKGTDILLTTTAKSDEGDVFYKFSVTNGAQTTVLSDFSSNNKVAWTPTVAGTYTITYDYMDTVGNLNQRTATYEVKDDAGIEDPILKGVSPKPGQVKKGTPISFTANAAGGKIGTNLLFYKFTVKDANGVVVNVPYYTKNASYNFTPTALGTYTVTISVQNSMNDVIERTFTYSSVDTIVDDPTYPTIAPPTSSGDYLRGDADANGDVTIIDTTTIQCYLAKMENIYINLDNADADLNGELSIMDATAIQLHLAKLDPNW